MTPIQQMFLGVGASKKTYMDDVFSTHLYTGTGSARSINNGIDLSGEGGLTWFKRRDDAYSHILVDTVRGAGNTKGLCTNSNSGEGVHSSLFNITSFNNNGFTIGVPSSTDIINSTNISMSNWSFRKAPGFFTICQWTGNGSEPRQIAHDLGCLPGLIVIKNLTTGSTDWRVWHRDFTATQCISLNLTNALVDDNNIFGGRNTGSVMPTSTYFEIGRDQDVNENGSNFIAYVFAGGESTAATARSVDFDGSNDYLTIPDNADWDLGHTFTIEAWVKLDVLNNYNVIIAQAVGGNNWYMSVNSNGSCQFYDFTGAEQIDSEAGAVSAGTWTHVAFVANDIIGQWYINGTKSGSAAVIQVQGGSNGVSIGAQGTSNKFNGQISNLRLVKGTAVYTSSFRPPTEPLTNITNTKLLCCNNSSTTGSTVTPGTITANGNPTASSDSPFDDPSGFSFGEAGDQNVIKTGSYVGNGNANGPDVYLGFEPQWVLTKNSSANDDWYILDSMRGIASDGNDARLKPSSSSAEQSSEKLNLTSTGFKVKTSNNDINGNGNTIIYMALRRPDPLVQKPAELGTDIFAMDTGNGSSTIPTFDSGFPVDFSLHRAPASANNWVAGARLIQGKYLATDSIGTENAWAKMVYDSNVGWMSNNSYNSTYQSWMWKRHAGFDVVTYKGNGTSGLQIPHSLSKTPEMIWIKSRGTITQWCVGHKGRNGGVNPWNYFSALNGTGADEDNNIAFNDTAPTSTHFTVGTGETSNLNNNNYLTMLFASVDGISKCGYYDGSSSAQTITTGFQPRFVIIKCTTNATNWLVLDTTRGWGSGDDKWLYLDTNNAQDTNPDAGYPVSTGFVVDPAQGTIINSSGHKYIYYAHA